MQNEIKVDDEFILHKGDAKFKIVIYNVNYYRPLDMTFAVLLYDEDGKEVKNPCDDFFFIGEDFFIKHKEEIEKIQNMDDKEKIINILTSELSYCYCDNCEYGNWDKYEDRYCDDCHRKYQNWKLSSYTAAEIAEQILKEVINNAK